MQAGLAPVQRLRQQQQVVAVVMAEGAVAVISSVMLLMIRLFSRHTVQRAQRPIVSDPSNNSEALVWVWLAR